MLLNHGADPDSSAESGGRALDYARSTPELYQLLVDHGAEPRESPGDRLINAVRDDDLPAAEALLGEHPDLARDPTLLHDAAHDGNAEKARLLLEHGADMNVVDEEYRSTPLGLAARAGHVDLVELLVESGADPTAAGAPWSTPLAWARRRGHQEIVAFLERRRGAS